MANNDNQEEYFTVIQGQLTFDSEGSETLGYFFSRKPHVPGKWSGVTIGRGYDIGMRTKREVISDLCESSVSLGHAMQLAECSGLKGDKAIEKLSELTELIITPYQQKKLFEITYERIKKDVIRICHKDDVVKKYGETNWNKTNPTIIDIFVDLCYRGDYTPKTRKKIQKSIVDNNLDELVKIMSDAEYWICELGVPKDRFERRVRYLFENTKKIEPHEKETKYGHKIIEWIKSFWQSF